MNNLTPFRARPSGKRKTPTLARFHHNLPVRDFELAALLDFRLLYLRRAHAPLSKYIRAEPSMGKQNSPHWAFLQRFELVSFVCYLGLATPSVGLLGATQLNHVAHVTASGREVKRKIIFWGTPRPICRKRSAGLKDWAALSP